MSAVRVRLAPNLAIIYSFVNQGGRVATIGFTGSLVYASLSFLEPILVFNAVLKKALVQLSGDCYLLFFQSLG